MKISIHLDTNKNRDNILFEYIQAFDLMIDFINQVDHMYGLDEDVLIEPINSIVRSYNTHRTNKE